MLIRVRGTVRVRTRVRTRVRAKVSDGLQIRVRRDCAFQDCGFCDFLSILYLPAFAFE